MLISWSIQRRRCCCWSEVKLKKSVVKISLLFSQTNFFPKDFVQILARQNSTNHSYHAPRLEPYHDPLPPPSKLTYTQSESLCLLERGGGRERESWYLQIFSSFLSHFFFALVSCWQQPLFVCLFLSSTLSKSFYSSQLLSFYVSLNLPWITAVA